MYCIRIQHRSLGFTLKPGRIINEGDTNTGQLQKETLGEQEKYLLLCGSWKKEKQARNTLHLQILSDDIGKGDHS